MTALGKALLQLILLVTLGLCGCRADPEAERPGLFRHFSQERSSGPFRVQSYSEPGAVSGGVSFDRLEWRGEQVRFDHGVAYRSSLTEAPALPAVAVWVSSAEPATNGLWVLFEQDGRLERRKVCDDMTGLVPWERNRYPLGPRCPGAFDLEARAVVEAKGT